jgi:hypothetical protein
MPLYPQSVMSQGVCPNSLPFHFFHFRFIFESIKELGSVSVSVIANVIVKIHPCIQVYNHHIHIL